MDTPRLPAWAQNELILSHPSLSLATCDWSTTILVFLPSSSRPKELAPSSCDAENRDPRTINGQQGRMECGMMQLISTRLTLALFRYVWSESMLKSPCPAWSVAGICTAWHDPIHVPHVSMRVACGARACGRLVGRLCHSLHCLTSCCILSMMVGLVGSASLSSSLLPALSALSCWALPAGRARLSWVLCLFCLELV